MDNEKEELQRKLDNILGKVKLPNKKEEVAELEKITYDANFWGDPKKAAETLKRISILKKEIDDIEVIEYGKNLEELNKKDQKVIDKQNVIASVEKNKSYFNHTRSYLHPVLRNNG